MNKGEYLKPFTKDIKPSIIQQNQEFLASFLNKNDLVIKDRSGRERNKALDAFNYNVQWVKYLTEYCAVMGRSRV